MTWPSSLAPSGIGAAMTVPFAVYLITEQSPSYVPNLYFIVSNWTLLTSLSGNEGPKQLLACNVTRGHVVNYSEFQSVFKKYFTEIKCGSAAHLAKLAVGTSITNGIGYCNFKFCKIAYILIPLNYELSWKPAKINR
jgi:hypothetical protein